ERDEAVAHHQAFGEELLDPLPREGPVSDRLETECGRNACCSGQGRQQRRLLDTKAIIAVEHYPSRDVLGTAESDPVAVLPTVPDVLEQHPGLLDSGGCGTGQLRRDGPDSGV